MIRVSGQSKSRPVKAAGAEVGAQRRNQKLHAAVAKSTFWSENVQNTDGLGALFEVQMSKNCTPLWRKAHLEVKMYKTDGPEHFLKFRCRKIARRCGEKHILKWKCTKHWGSGSTFWSSDVEKLHAAVAKSTLEVKMLKNWGSRSTFWSSDVEKLHAAQWRKAHLEVKMYKTRQFQSLFEVRCRKISQVVS